MSKSVATRKQKRKSLKHARRANRKIKRKRTRLNPFNSAEARKEAKRRRRESRSNSKKRKNISGTKRYAEKILGCLDCNTIESLAKLSGFIIRKSKLSPIYFFSMLVLSYLSCGDKSFTLMASNLENWFNISSTAQSISARLKLKRTSKFFKECFGLYLSMKLELYTSRNGYAEFLKMFSGIKISDSSSIELSERLAKKFKGSGGGASKSALKLNFIYDVFSSTTSKIDIKQGCYSDKNFAIQAIRYIRKKELLIRDLGYFSLAAFQAIADKGAYYLSRLQKGLKVYLQHSDDNPVEIGSFLKKHTHNGKIIDQPLFVGHQKLPARLIGIKVPKWVVKQRMKKIKISHKIEPGADYLIWCGYTVFITNIPSETCSAELIVELYSIRWQIELLFKTYKTTLKLDVIKGTSKYSVLCIVYAKLIGILLTEKIISFAAVQSEKQGRELSKDKAVKWLSSGDQLVYAILNGELDQMLSRLIQQLKYLYKDKRNKNPSTQKKVIQIFQEPKSSFLHMSKKQKAA